MKILLTGANGYVARRLLPELLAEGHEIICAIRDQSRLGIQDETLQRIKIWEVDFLNPIEHNDLIKDIDIAYYLIHSMSHDTKEFDILEEKAAKNFNIYMSKTKVKQVIYLSGIVNNYSMSKHLKSRYNVEKILFSSNYHLTVLRAGIIVGSGSASFEIIRDLSEKLPIMVAPKWVNTKTNPIAIRDVVKYMIGIINIPETFDKSFDIASNDVLSYKDLLLQYAQVRKIKLWIFTVPLISPRFSSYWLYFITSTTYNLAVNLVNSLKIEVIAHDKEIQKILPFRPISYKEAIALAFEKIEQNIVISSWKDSLSSTKFSKPLQSYISVPTFGCFKDKKKMAVVNINQTLENIWSIGGDRGWYYGTWMWAIRGQIDKIFGGVGLRRGRTHPTHLDNGDSLDFWRVIMADKDKKRLLLFAEMKVPGEAWLDFYIDEANVLHQTATFRPKGLWGRFYWFLMLPFHYFIFNGMIKNIVNYNSNQQTGQISNPLNEVV